jgi:hypothetical protein
MVILIARQAEQHMPDSGSSRGVEEQQIPGVFRTFKGEYPGIRWKWERP